MSDRSYRGYIDLVETQIPTVVKRHLVSKFEINDQIYLPAALTVTYGTAAGGSTYDDLLDSHANYVDITEAAGANALQADVRVDGVTGIINKISIRGYYAGNAAHYITVALYNNTTSAYDILGTMPNAAAYSWFNFDIPDYAHYVNASNQVTIRFNHPQSGVATHHLYLDYVALSNSIGGSTAISNYVIGPDTSTDNAIPRFNFASGRSIKNSGVTIDDSNNLILPADIYTTPWTAITDTANIEGIDDYTGGWLSYFYKKIGTLCYVHIDVSGHMNAGSAILHVTLPYAISAMLIYSPCSVCSNSTWQIGVVYFHGGVSTNQAVFGVGSTGTTDNFDATAGAVKAARFFGCYRVA